MAKRRVGGGRYRMTPKRRAALKKAQMVSARKRRRAKIKNGLRVAGQVGAAVGATFVTYHGNQYIRHPSRIPKHAKIAKDTTSRIIKAYIHHG